MKSKSLREKAGRVVEKDPTRAVAHQGSNATYRAVIRRLTGVNGEAMWQVLTDIAMGKIWVPTTDDGRQAPPVIPTVSDRKDAAIYLLNALHGRPSTQERVVQAEAAAQAAEEFRKLPDAELKAIVREYLESGEQEVDGEIVEPKE